MKVELPNNEIFDIYSQLEVEMAKHVGGQMLETRYDNMRQTINHIWKVFEVEEDSMTHWRLMLEGLYEELYNVNLTLYNTRDIMRTHEEHNKFGDDYVELCRTIYNLNEEKDLIKKRIASIVDLIA
jgi:hypothetical protein